MLGLIGNFRNLLLESAPEAGLRDTIVWFVVGMVIMYLIEQIIPEDGGCSNHVHQLLKVSTSGEDLDRSNNVNINISKQSAIVPTGAFVAFHRFYSLFGGNSVNGGPMAAALARTGFVTYLGLALHNLPEGVSVAVSTTSSLRLGVSLCVAIMLHNVLEGMVVALPLWFGTRSRPKVLILTLINGMMEPLGGMYCIYILLVGVKSLRVRAFL